MKKSYREKCKERVWIATRGRVYSSGMKAESMSEMESNSSGSRISAGSN